MFADDTKLFKSIKSSTDIIHLQSDFNALLRWCDLNGFSCNSDKCFQITIGRSNVLEFNYLFKNQPLQKLSVIKDLGVFFDSNLTFQYHIDYVVNKAIKKVNFIKRYTKQFKNLESFRTLYFSFVYSTISYCSVIWRPSNLYQLKQLEKPRHIFL